MSNIVNFDADLDELCPDVEYLPGGGHVETGDEDIGVQPDGQADDGHAPAVHLQGGQGIEGGVG